MHILWRHLCRCSAFVAPASQIAAVAPRTAAATMFVGKSSSKPAAKKSAVKKAAPKPAFEFENPFAKKSAPAPAKKSAKKVVKKTAAKKAPAAKPAFSLPANPFVGGAAKKAEEFDAEKIPGPIGGFITGFNLLRNLPKN